MAECGAVLDLAVLASGARIRLACDLDPKDHAGLNHHDGAYGLWWFRCELDEHGHRAGRAGSTVRR